MKSVVDGSALSEFAQKLLAKLKTIFALKSDVGTPLVAATAAEMADESKIYVYTGTESGYTAGNWYYYSGSAWASGGVYNSAAVSTELKARFLSTGAADATVIGSSSNLNDFLTPGNYRVSTSTVAATLINSPVTDSGFMLKVLETSGSNRCVQILIPNAATGQVFVRPYTGQWRAWTQLLSPAAPANDGTYMLTCTVTGGVATYAWVSTT